MRKNGFTLLELSIVLVIIGLIAGGVVGGKNLIHSAELRRVLKERDSFVTATLGFKDKYDALPGDMRDATAYWGVSNAGCPGNNTDNGTCNGDGSGVIGAPNWYDSPGTPNTREPTRYWQHLSLSGFLNGSYKGWSSLGGCLYDGECPKSSYNNAFWSVPFNIASIPSYTPFYPNSGNNHIFVIGAADYNNSPLAPIMTAADAANLDKKMDDGIAGKGKIMGLKSSYRPQYVSVPVGATGNCTSSDDAATATYLIANTDMLCALVINIGL